MIIKQKKKYNISDFITKKPIQYHKEVFNCQNSVPNCICGKFSVSQSTKCFRCKGLTHSCVSPKSNRQKQTVFECLRCIARNLDPIYIPQRYIIQTFFQTRNIFLNDNEISFQFEMSYENLKREVQVRSIQMNRLDLCWPMQGSFYINDSPQSIFDLKPLMANTNRKTRREEYFMISPSKLKIGLNKLTFKIPQLDKSFGDNFKFQQMRQYFLTIYSVHVLTMQQLIQKITKENRTQKQDTLKILKYLSQIGGQISVVKQKIKLNCPYTGNRIKFPVRGKYCMHLTCICLETFITMQQKNRKWNCPICLEYINQPQVDIWMLEILNDNNKGDIVQISLDGTYKWVEEKQVQSLDSSSDDDSDKNIEANKQRLQQQIKTSRKMVQQLPCFQIDANKEILKQSSYQPIQMIQIDEQIPDKQNQRQDFSFIQPYPFQDFQRNKQNHMQIQQNQNYQTPNFGLQVHQQSHSPSFLPSPFGQNLNQKIIQINVDNQEEEQRKADQKKKLNQQKLNKLKESFRLKKQLSQQILKRNQRQKLQELKKIQQKKRFQTTISVQKRPPQVQYSTLQKSKSISLNNLQQVKKEQDQKRKKKMVQQLEKKLIQGMINQIKDLSFKQMSTHQFVRKYCKLPVNQYKKQVNDDLKKIFKNIL